MKKIQIIITSLVTTGPLILPTFVSCSNTKNEVEALFSRVITKNLLGSFCFRFKDQIDGQVTVSLKQKSNNLMLPENKIIPIGHLVEFGIKFNKDQSVGFVETFGLEFEFKTTTGKIKQLSLQNLQMVYEKEDDLEFQCNNYAESQNTGFLENISMAEHDYFPDYCSNFFCNSDAEACINWAHHPGYPLWNEKLHRGESLDDDGVSYQQFDYPGIESYKRLTRNKDYKFLDHALNLSTVGNINVHDGDHSVGHVYHGFEPDECDLENFIDTLTEKSMSTDNASSWTQSDVNKLTGQSYIDLGYLATSFNYDYSFDWAKTSTEYGAAPFLDLTIDSDVGGAYISYSRRTFYGIYLSRPENYQLLIQRGAKITISDATLITPAETGANKNVIYIKANVSLNI